MPRQHSPQQQFKEAKQIASDHGLYVVEKGGRFLLYRKTAPHPTYIGARATAASLRSFVCKVAGFH